MAEKRIKRPRDPIQRAKLIRDIVTGQVEDKPEDGDAPVHKVNNAFLKKVENNIHAIFVYFLSYNFVRIHKTLRVTPAMEAGVTDKLWELSDMVNIAD